jgi:TetR/AcrR family transcriptional repressor of nem operon
MGRISDARERLLEAAKHLIWEQSYGAVTVDAICHRARVRKGSFYHFFDSKSDLAVASLEADWQARKPLLDAIFSQQRLPLDRLTLFFDEVYKLQCALKKECGYVLGCPVFNLGAEICTRDTILRAKILEIISGYIGYFEGCIRDGQKAGVIAKVSPDVLARWLFTFFEGALAQARIENDPASLRKLAPGAMQIIGARLALAA